MGGGRRACTDKSRLHVPPGERRSLPRRLQCGNIWEGRKRPSVIMDETIFVCSLNLNLFPSLFGSALIPPPHRNFQQDQINVPN